jgi:hypothetical protein
MLSVPWEPPLRYVTVQGRQRTPAHARCARGVWSRPSRPSIGNLNGGVLGWTAIDKIVLSKNDHLGGAARGQIASFVRVRLAMLSNSDSDSHLLEYIHCPVHFRTTSRHLQLTKNNKRNNGADLRALEE